MRIDNHTTHPNSLIRRLVQFAGKGINTTGLRVVVRTDEAGFHGWYGHRRFHIGNREVQREIKTSDKAVTVLYVPRLTTYPLRWPNVYRLKRVRARFPDFPLDGWEDSMVKLAAHEIRHHRQAIRYLARKAKQRFSEHDAELGALRKLNQYREATGRYPIPEVKQRQPDQLAACRR